MPQTQKLLIRYDGVGANVILLGQIIDTRHMGGVLNSHIKIIQVMGFDEIFAVSPRIITSRFYCQ